MGFTRTKTLELLDTLEKGRSVLLFGPRQTGKTTLIEDVFARFPANRCLRYYFQLPSTRERIEADPEVIRREVEAMRLSEPVYLLIDEIQKIPKVMDVLQFLIDKKKIILAATGSSARKMKTMGTNWLPGRVRLDHLYPLTWKETGFPENRLDQILLYGALPGVLSEQDAAEREKTLASYAHLYLEEEIRAEALVRNVPRFTKFLRLAALESGTAPNLSKIGQHVELSHTTIKEYFQILEDTLIVHRVDAFGSKRDAVLRTSRYYFFDLGVRNAAANIGHSPGILTLQMGTLFEHFIILEAIARFRDSAVISYWRTKQGSEVDLVIDQKGKLLPVEIKATERPSEDDFAGLTAFLKRYQCKQGYLVCRIPRPQKFGSCLAVPWHEFCESGLP